MLRPREFARFVSLTIWTLFVACLATSRPVSADGPRIEIKPFGRLPNGAESPLYVIHNGAQLELLVMPFGATIVTVRTPDRDGRWADVTLRLPTFDDYWEKRTVLGTVIGRYANRIAGACFTIDGEEYRLAKNSGPNHIHGGREGFHRKPWHVAEVREPERTGVRLSYTSADGEEGYPGTLKVDVVYAVTPKNELIMEYRATTDKATHLNLTNHAYWNLSGEPNQSVLDHELTLWADEYLPTDSALIPTGDPVSVEGTPLDFRRPARIGARIDDLKNGYDHCFVLRKEPGQRLALAARLKDPSSGRAMEVFTTQPGMQVYSDGARRKAVCLETQHYPDSPNQPRFPSTLLRPGETYHHTTIHRFYVEK